MIKEFSVLSRDRCQLIDITDKVEKIIKESKIKDGLVLVFVSHSTAAIILTENESNLKQDWLQFLKKMISDFNFLHDRIDNNADSHLLSGLLGQSKALIIENSRLIRGTWQQIFLVELDGPKNRKIIIKIIFST